MTVRLHVDLTEISAFTKKHLGQDWPKAVVDAFGELAEEGRDGARALTRQKFKLRSEWVTNGIKHYPANKAQKDRSAHALKKYGDVNAAVFLRGATDPKKSLEFMAHHETSEERDPQDKYIAVPMQGVRQKSFKTGKGRVRKRWKPETLLKRFHESGSRYDGRTTINNGRGLGYRRGRTPGAPFLIASRKKGEPMIVRRRRRRKGESENARGNLEFFYILKPKARIKEIWGFVDGVYESVGHHYVGVIAKHIATLPGG